MQPRQAALTTTGSPQEALAARSQAARKSPSVDSADRDAAGLELIAKVRALIAVLESCGEVASPQHRVDHRVCA
jgi:hypothetical protein